MKLPLTSLCLRHTGVALAVASIFLLGCAHKVQIEVPANFHGHVRIQCTGLTDEHTANLRVDADGTLNAANCPVRQTEAVVTRGNGGAAPVETAVMWTTTGDGLVREITFDVK